MNKNYLLFIILLIVFLVYIITDSVNYNMVITNENNCDKNVDILVEWNVGDSKGYMLKNVLIEQKLSDSSESGSLSSSNNKMNFTIFLYDLNSTNL